MVFRLLNFSIRNLSITTTGVALTAFLATLPLPVKALTLITQRTNLGGNDQIDWSSLGSATPFNILSNSFSATSQRGLGLNIEIPRDSTPGITPPLVFQTLPPPPPTNIATNFASGDFVLFTGFNPVSFPAIGNPGPLTITFEQPVLGAGTQIATDDAVNFTAFISAYDNTNTLLGTFQAEGTSSLALDNSALFLGVKSDTPNISKLVVSTSISDRAIGINALSIRTVPETNSVLSLLILGSLCVGITLKRNRGDSCFPSKGEQTFVQIVKRGN